MQNAGQGTGSLSYASAQQVKALLEQFVVKVVDPEDDSVSTGFFVNSKALLLTCWHVVEPAGEQESIRHRVWIEYRGERYTATVLPSLSNRNKDIAVLQVQGEEFERLQQYGFGVAPLAFPFHAADPVAALGYQRQDVLDDALLLRGYIDPDNMLLPVSLVDGKAQECLMTVFRHAHFDLGMSGAPLLDMRTGRVVGMEAGVLPSNISPTNQPLGCSVPLRDIRECWPDFAADCNVLDYDPVLDDDIVPQSKEFLRHESFTERPKWAAHSKSFLSDRERRSGYLLLIGGEGEGKTAFMAYCVQNAIEPVFHFIRRTEPDWDDPERMLRSLTAQLLRKHGVGVNANLQERLATAGSTKERVKTTAAIFADVLERVSRVLVANDKQEVVWIDGLDEAFGPTGEYHDTPGLPGLLPALLPPGIYAVLTSRPGVHLYWQRDPSLCVRCRLEDERDTNVTDVRRYLTEHANDMDPPLDPDYIARAAEKTQGNFLVAVGNLTNIKRAPTADRDPNAIPENVQALHAEVYHRVNTRASQRNIEEENVRFILGLLAEVREPLTLEHLRAFKAPRDAELVLSWAADYFRPRPIHRDPHLPYEFNHTSIPEFLSRQLTVEERRDIHESLATACLEWRNLHGDARLYALRYLPTHLIAASKGA